MNALRYIRRSSILALLTIAVIGVPIARAKISDDQVKSAGAIKLTTDLLDKMSTVAKAVRADEAARTEMAAVNAADMESSIAGINSKCPKALVYFKEAGITPEELMKGMSAMLACFMDDGGELANSSNETAKANAEFVKANKDRVDKVGGEVMAISQPPDAK